MNGSPFYSLFTDKLGLEKKKTKTHEILMRLGRGKLIKNISFPFRY